MRTRGQEDGRLLAAALLPATGLLVAAFVYTLSSGYDPTDVLADPADTFDYSGRYGAVSMLGVMTWTAAGAVALHAAGDARLDAALRAWLRRAGFLTVGLALDDALMLHERLGWRVPGGEPVVIGLILLAAAAAIVPGWRAVCRHPHHRLLLPPLALLGASVALDAVEVRLAALLALEPTSIAVAEEVAKYLGIAAWLAAVIGLGRVLTVPPSER